MNHADQAARDLLELLMWQSETANAKAPRQWLVTETSNDLLAQSQKQVSEYVRETRALVESVGKNAPVRSGTFAEFRSKGFEMMRDTGAAYQQQANEAMDVVDKAVVTAKA